MGREWKRLAKNGPPFGRQMGGEDFTQAAKTLLGISSFIICSTVLLVRPQDTRALQDEILDLSPERYCFVRRF